MTTLTELLSPRNRDTLEALLLSVLQEAPIEGEPGGFPVTDWIEGGFERTFVKMAATGLLDREDTIRMLTASGFLRLASTLLDADGNPIEGWMEILAAQNYGRDRNDATYTKQVLTLTCTSGPGPYTRSKGELVAYSPSTGNKYVLLDDEVTIPDGGSVTAVFQAESPGVGYQDSIGSIVALVTPLPGVSVTNAATPAGLPASYITGSGSIAVSSTTITTSRRTVKLAFTTAGRADDNSAAFTCTVYQGGAATTTGPFAASGTFTQGDLEVTLTDGAEGTQSFNEGDEWIVGLPGTPLIQMGAEKETLAALALRCQDRFAEQSVIPTGNRFEGWVRACEAAQHLGVVKVKARPSLTVSGIEDVYIAGTTATATPAQVAAVQAYLDEQSGQVDYANVAAAAAVAVAVGGTIRCRRGTTAAVKSAADLAWIKYIAALALGGEQPDGLVELLALENAMHDAGAFNATGLTLNGTAADLVLTAFQCATLDESAGLPSQGMTWQEIA